MSDEPSTIRIVRRLLLVLVVFGLGGTFVDLLLMHHYDGLAQNIPLVLLMAGLVASVWHGLRPSAATVRSLQSCLTLLALAGLAGVLLHYNGIREFQLEVNPDVKGWPLFLKIIQAHDPPLLAPATLVQISLLGIIHCIRHPALGKTTPPE